LLNGGGGVRVPRVGYREDAMSAPGLHALVDAARTYEGLFVGALFGQWPPMVLDAAGIGPGQRVLDVACGTGVLARAAAARTGPTGYVAGIEFDVQAHVVTATKS
jgi:2-polyprenyl-3-methyl-5-hydroxy-6-metoxy-1,4-benzoquinol methylase